MTSVSARGKSGRHVLVSFRSENVMPKLAGRNPDYRDKSADLETNSEALARVTGCRGVALKLIVVITCPRYRLRVH
jgi:hypothetical protein